MNPQIVEQYRGGDIALSNGAAVISSVMFPVLHQLIGHSLITSDGKTLLDADDKAGLAEIVTAMVRLKEQNMPHGPIRIAFTPDEEVCKRPQFFDIARFGAKWAYTLDGSGLGKLEYENFNAASVTVKMVGNNLHPGTVKGMTLNPLSLGNRYHQMMPLAASPAASTGYEGFYYLNTMKSSVEKAEMHYIVRDFDRQRFEELKQFMITSAETLGEGLHPDCYIALMIEDNYYNMHEHVAKHPHIIELARLALVECGVEPVIKPSHRRYRWRPAFLAWTALPECV